VRKDEIPKWITFNRNDHLRPEVADKEYPSLLNEYPDIALFLDIDMYRTGNLTSQEARDFYPIATARLEKLSGDFVQYLFSQD
jgi:hypothetical protein